MWHSEIYSKLFIDTFPVWIFYALGILNETTKRENSICFLRFLVIYNVYPPTHTSINCEWLDKNSHSAFLRYNNYRWIMYSVECIWPSTLAKNSSIVISRFDNINIIVFIHWIKNPSVKGAKSQHMFKDYYNSLIWLSFLKARPTIN